MVSKILYEMSVESERCEMFMAEVCVLDLLFQRQKSCRILREGGVEQISRNLFENFGGITFLPRNLTQTPYSTPYRMEFPMPTQTP
jgi:hypothetical protein